MRRVFTILLVIIFIANLTCASALFIASANPHIIDKAVTLIAQKTHVDLNELEFGAPKRLKWTFIVKDFLKLGYTTAFAFAFLSLLFLFLRDTVLDECRSRRLTGNTSFFKKIVTVENGILLFATLVLCTIKLWSPQVPVYNPDGYQNMAFNFLNDGGITYNKGRNFIYPSFILLSTLLFHNFKGVVVMQHLLGSFAGIFLYKSFGVIAKQYQDHKNGARAIRITGIATYLLYAASNIPFFWEKWFMKEGISAFVYALFLYLLITFFVRIARSEPILKTGSGLLILNYFIFSYQSRWGFAFLFISAAVLAAIIILQKKEGIKKQILYAVAIPMTICVLFIALPEKLLSFNDTPKKWFGPLNFLFSHMNMISIEMEKDLANPKFDRYDRALLAATLEQYRNAATDDPKYHALGYDFNQLFWGTAKNELINGFHGDFGQLKKFALHYYLRAVFHQPFAMCTKITTVLSDYYAVNADRLQYKTDIEYAALYRYASSWTDTYQSSANPVIKKLSGNRRISAHPKEFYCTSRRKMAFYTAQSSLLSAGYCYADAADSRCVYRQPAVHVVARDLFYVMYRCVLCESDVGHFIYSYHAVY